MKTMRSTITGFLILLMMLGVSSVSQAETWESVKKKEFNQSYSVSKNGLLSVENRFGNITITHWNKSEVSIQVKVESSANNEQIAQRNLDRIRVDIRKDGDKVSAITTIGELNQSGSQNQQFQINYFISIPSTMNIDLNQRFGNINLPSENEGEAELEVKYGNITGGSFSKSLELDAGYSNVSIQNVVNAELSLAYCGDVKLGNGRQIEIDNKYSNVNMGNADALEVELKYGNLKAKTVKSASLEVKYSNVTIDNISEELLAGSLDYSTMNIDELNSNFKRVDVASRYGKLSISIASKAAFRIDAERVGDNLSIQGLNKTKHDIADKINHVVEINGGGSGRIRFDGNNYSSLTIRAK